MHFYQYDYATKYVLSTSSSGNIKAMAILVNNSDTAGVNDNFIYVAKCKTNNDGFATVYAVVDGEVKTIEVKDYAGELGAYTYKMDGEQYKLGIVATIDESFKTIAKVTEKTVVVNGKEYKVDATTEIALIDGSDSEMLTLADLNENDTVCLYDEDNDDTAEAIYVMEQYDSTNAAILCVDGTYVKVSTTDGVKYDIKHAAKYSEIAENMVISAEATAYISTTKYTNIDDVAKPANKLTGATVATDGIKYIYVVSKSGTVFNTYKVDVAVS